MNTFDFYTRQEKSFVLSQFLHGDALELGSFISFAAAQKNYPIAIQIEVSGECVYKYMNDGAAPNNFEWIRKKSNVVKRFQMSSAAFAAKLEERNASFAELYGNEIEYAVTPGAFPIRVNNVGIIGVVGVSGLDSDSDHELIIKGFEHLQKKQEGKE